MRINSFGNRSYTYRVTDPPTSYPISISTARSYLKVTSSIDDELIKLLIEQATDFAEKYTGRYFINRTIETFRDFFPSAGNSEGYYNFGNPSGYNLDNSSIGFEIRRSPLSSIVSISYLSSGLTTVVDPSTYYNTLESDYSEILNIPGKSWPQDVDDRLQSITIKFICGFGSDEKNVPGWVKIGILQHIASLYENRGDCIENNTGSTSNSAPKSSILIYNQNRIYNL